MHDAGYTKGISYSSAPLLHKETKDKKTSTKRQECLEWTVHSAEVLVHVYIKCMLQPDCKHNQFVNLLT